MAIVPKRKTSKARKRKRRAHHALVKPNLVTVNGEKTLHRLVKYFKREDLSSKDSNSSKTQKVSKSKNKSSKAVKNKSSKTTKVNKESAKEDK